MTSTSFAGPGPFEVWTVTATRSSATFGIVVTVVAALVLTAYLVHLANPNRRSNR